MSTDPDPQIDKDDRCSFDRLDHLSFQDEFAFFISLRDFVRTVVFPAHLLIAFHAEYIAHDMHACSHLSLVWITLADIHNAAEEVGSPMLPLECL